MATRGHAQARQPLAEWAVHAVVYIDPCAGTAHVHAHRAHISSQRERNVTHSVRLERFACLASSNVYDCSLSAAPQMADALPAIGKNTLCGTALFVAYESALPASPSSSTAWTFVASSSAGTPTYWVPEYSLGRVAIAGFAAGAAQGACEVAWDSSGVFVYRQAL